MGLSEQNPINHQEYKQGICQLMNLFTLTFQFHALEKEMATTPVFLPGKPQGQGSLVGRTESDTTEVT